MVDIYRSESNRSQSDNDLLIGKKVFIKRGDHQARIAMIVEQAEEDMFVVQFGSEDVTATYTRSDFVPLSRGKLSYFHTI